MIPAYPEDRISILAGAHRLVRSAAATMDQRVISRACDGLTRCSRTRCGAIGGTGDARSGVFGVESPTGRRVPSFTSQCPKPEVARDPRSVLRCRLSCRRARSMSSRLEGSAQPMYPQRSHSPRSLSELNRRDPHARHSTSRSGDLRVALFFFTMTEYSAVIPNRPSVYSPTIRSSKSTSHL